VSAPGTLRYGARSSSWLRFRSAYLDRAAAALALVAAAPVLAVLAALVRWRDGPPSLIKLQRVGAGGAPFDMWKLRTMRAVEVGGAAGGAAITAGNDPRITPTGAWLRRWRLDEVPQLVNVVRGEMALFGPRPETPALVDLADPGWQAVLGAPPGIAGATQLTVEAWEAASLHGEPHEDRYREEILPVKLAIDRWYVERATARIDLAVLTSMVERFLLGRADTRVQALVRRQVPAAAAVPAGRSER
jgi:lipopolysaccharide/colanic/teichoic acid biosynthesis glycosyltransferase